MVRSAGTSGGPSKKKKHPLPARSNAASSLEESRQRYKVSTFGSSGLRTNSGLCRGLKSLQVVPEVGCVLFRNLIDLRVCGMMKNFLADLLIGRVAIFHRRIPLRAIQILRRLRLSQLYLNLRSNSSWCVAILFDLMVNWLLLVKNSLTWIIKFRQWIIK